MPTYKIEITETLQRQIEVEASSKEEALKKIKEQYPVFDKEEKK